MGEGLRPLSVVCHYPRMLMPRQYSDEEIDAFIQMLQRDVKQNLSKTRTTIPMGFALGRVDPYGTRKRCAHIVYAKPIRSYSRLFVFSSRVRTMALLAEAEVAGCVVVMPAVVHRGSNAGATQGTVMIHAEQLFLGHRCWHAQVQVVDGEANVTEFEELNIRPHPDHLSFLPVEMYGAATVYA